MHISDKIDRGSVWTPEEIAEACELTAEAVEGHWAKGEWHYNDGVQDYYCLEGALATVLGLDASNMNVDEDDNDRVLLLECPVSKEIVKTINLRYPSWDLGEDDIPNWNDNDSRTEEEVLDILHLTAKRVLGVDITPIDPDTA